MAIGMAASPTKKETVTLAEKILKNKGDRTTFQNDATFSKLSSGNQSDEEDENISKSTLEKCATNKQTQGLLELSSATSALMSPSI